VTGFYIAEVRFRGRNVPDAAITLKPGLSVVAGPSNTGKSLLRTAINFVFGSGDAMKDIPERAPYSTILVEVRTYDGQIRTYERAWNGGGINEYHTPAAETPKAKPVRELSETHSADRDDNISRALLALAGFDDVRLLSNQSGETKSLSFRSLIPYLLVSEERIITELSPLHSGSPIHETIETALFRTLLTGIDDRDVIKTLSAKEQKAQAAGREIAIEAMREELRAQIDKSAMAETDAQRAANAITERINEQSRRLEAYRTDTTAIEQRRRELHQESERALARITQIDANLKRFALLQEQYNSDLRRLQSNIEAGSLIGDMGEGPCPICGAAAEHHHHTISQQQLEDYTQACRIEADKISVRQSDLNATMSQLKAERVALTAQRATTERERQNVANQLKGVLEPGIGELNQSLGSLVERRQELEQLLGLFEQLRRLDKLEESLKPAKKKRGEKSAAVATVPPNAFEEFAKGVEDLLRAWTFPELDRVVFDTSTEDIVISGKARKDNGKGYRAITYAAFVIATMLEAQRKALPHPGFVVLDSPLVTYREPQEHMGEGVKNAFFRNLATLHQTQVIILENEEPPEDLKPSISFTGFSKSRTTGRYGLLQPLPAPDSQ
jgi:hypothetical protein